MTPCKQKISDAIIIYSSGEYACEAYLHRKGCMGARQTHIDIILNKDPCGLRDFLRRGGHCIKIKRVHGEVEIDLSNIMRYTCIILLRTIDMQWNKVYIMISKSGNLYVTGC